MKFFKLIVCALLLGLTSQVYAAAGAPETAAESAEQITAKKILVVYYSRTGNTERVAQDIARVLNADNEQLIDKKDRSGVVGYMKAGKDATKESLAEIAPIINDPAKYDLIIVGTPVWAWNMSSAVRTYITNNKASFKEAAFFTTSGGTKPEKIVAKMEALAGLKAKASTGFVPSDLKKSNQSRYDKMVSDFVAALK